MTNTNYNQFFINIIIFQIMKEKLEQKVVTDVTTKKKYVKPDFEVIELKMEAPLLSASGPLGTTGTASFGNNGALSTSSWGSNN